MPAKKSICFSPAVVAVASAITAFTPPVVESSQKMKPKTELPFATT